MCVLQGQSPQCSRGLSPTPWGLGAIPGSLTSPVTSPGPVLVLRPVANGSDESLKCSQGQRDPCVSFSPRAWAGLRQGHLSPQINTEVRGPAAGPWLGAVGMNGERGDRGHGPPPGLRPSALQGALRTGGCSNAQLSGSGDWPTDRGSGASCTHLPPRPASLGPTSQGAVGWGTHGRNPQVTALWGYPEFLRALAGTCRAPRSPAHSSLCSYSRPISPSLEPPAGPPAQRSARGWAGPCDS